ncbi:hypothetical protein QFC19_004485 [Naganishia cerealis]|uniref:Uncharacterized protein n=1 Tax=Naganishia cerealis TaxID=610337 RepID=A0ACC2VWA1_9TREE|nr:hypothetical protein QFC19_004485 [Naganishia cerealis]
MNAAAQGNQRMDVPENLSREQTEIVQTDHEYSAKGVFCSEARGLNDISVAVVQGPHIASSEGPVRPISPTPMTQPLGQEESPEPPSKLTLQHAREQSKATWTRDLQGIYEHAKERFADVKWVEHVNDDPSDWEEAEFLTEDKVAISTDAVNAILTLKSPHEEKHLDETDVIFGHKAIIYARASKAFKDRYFPVSVTGTSSTQKSDGTHALDHYPATSVSTPNLHHQPQGTRSSRSASSLSPLPLARSWIEDGASSDLNQLPDFGRGVSTLSHHGTPEMLKQAVEWLYTARIPLQPDTAALKFNQMGRGEEVLDLISEADAEIQGLVSAKGANGLDMVGVKRLQIDQLRLAQMVDHSRSSTRNEHQEHDIDDVSVDGNEETVFSAHRFILCSRSPYLHQVLLNSGAFQSHPAAINPSSGTDLSDIPEITLPSPPFTPQATYFTLGYLYSGSLSFSNKTFDLPTAFSITKAAMFLEVDSLVDELHAIIREEHCHGMIYPVFRNGKKLAGCACKKCLRRIPKVLRFAQAPDVQAIRLKQDAIEYLVQGWAECWGKDLANLDEDVQEDLLHRICLEISVSRIVASYSKIVNAKAKMDVEKGDCVEILHDMLDVIRTALLKKLVIEFQDIAANTAFIDLLTDNGMNRTLRDLILQDLIDSVSKVDFCHHAPQIYQVRLTKATQRSVAYFHVLQVLVNKLLKGTVGPEHLQLLAHESSGRHAIERTKREVLAVIKRRWLQMKPLASFDGLEDGTLKEISQGKCSHCLLWRFEASIAIRRAPASGKINSTSSGVSQDPTTSKQDLTTRPSASATSIQLRRTREASDHATQQAPDSEPSASARIRSISTPTARGTITDNRSSLPTASDATKTSVRTPVPSRIGAGPTNALGRIDATGRVAGAVARITANASRPPAIPKLGPRPPIGLRGSASSASLRARKATTNAPEPTVNRDVNASRLLPKKTSISSSLSRTLVPSSNRCTTPLPSNRATGTLSASKSANIQAANGTRSPISSKLTSTSIPRRTELVSSLKKATSIPATPSTKGEISSEVSKVAVTGDSESSVPATDIPQATSRRSLSPPLRPNNSSSDVELSPRPLRPLRLVEKRNSILNGEEKYPDMSSRAHPFDKTPSRTSEPSVGMARFVTVSEASHSGPECPTVQASYSSASPRDRLLASERIHLKDASPTLTTWNSSVSDKYHPAAAFDPPPRIPSISVTELSEEVDEDCIPYDPRKGISLSIGIPCVILLNPSSTNIKVKHNAFGSSRPRLRAVCRYIGQVNGMLGEWVGVEINTASLDKISDILNGEDGDVRRARGPHDGSWNGIRYYKIHQVPASSLHFPGRAASRPASPLDTYNHPDPRTWGHKTSHRSLRTPSPVPLLALDASRSMLSDLSPESTWITSMPNRVEPGTKCGLWVRSTDVVFIPGAND